MRVVCVSRHRYLSEHLCRFFEQAGIATVPSVGIDEAIEAYTVMAGEFSNLRDRFRQAALISSHKPFG